MSQAIDIIAFIGSNCEANCARGSELDKVLKAAGFEDARGSMLFNIDREQLEGMLGVRPTICCLVHAPEEEEAPLEEEEPGEGGKEDEEGEDSQDADSRDA